MSDRVETYSSAGLRVLFMNFWTCFHASYKSIFYWYHPKMHQLEMATRRKWESTKDLPLRKVISKKYKEKDEFFNPM